VERTQTYLAGALAVIGAGVFAGAIHLACVFPKTMETWADEGRDLSGAQQTLANLSNLCTSAGFLVLPVLLLVVIGCGAWAVVAGMSGRPKPASQAMENAG
jgi:hypothetical protein